MSNNNPRQVAFSILTRIDKERSYADILLDRELRQGELQGPDKGFLTELVYGILRRQGTLDHVIGQFSKVRFDKLERAVLILLRIGLYQLLFLDRVPASAAVNETVKLAHLLAPNASGFINAVLRQADRKRDAIAWPDRGKNPVAWLAARHSLPEWIAREWLDQLNLDEAEMLARTMSEAPPHTVRANTLRIGRSDLILRLEGEGAAATPCEHSPFGLRISSPVPLIMLTSYRDGLFTVQDEASQLVAHFLGAVAGEKVLDICAAPGGKTTCLAELMENRGEITASDVNPRRLEQVTALARRLGVEIISITTMDAERPLTDPALRCFNRVLVDAPCSGLGVLRRNPEGKWWKQPADVTNLAAKQKAILGNASACVAPGGILLYATCSTTVAENEGVIDDFLSRNRDFMLEDLRELFPRHTTLFTELGHFRTWPHLHGMDGFFAARLKRMEH